MRCLTFGNQQSSEQRNTDKIYVDQLAKKIKWTATSYPYAPNRSQLYDKNKTHMH